MGAMRAEPLGAGAGCRCPVRAAAAPRSTSQHPAAQLSVLVECATSPGQAGPLERAERRPFRRVPTEYQPRTSTHRPARPRNAPPSARGGRTRDIKSDPRSPQPNRQSPLCSTAPPAGPRDHGMSWHGMTGGMPRPPPCGLPPPPRHPGPCALVSEPRLPRPLPRQRPGVSALSLTLVRPADPGHGAQPPCRQHEDVEHDDPHAHAGRVVADLAQDVDDGGGGEAVQQPALRDVTAGGGPQLGGECGGQGCGAGGAGGAPVPCTRWPSCQLCLPYILQFLSMLNCHNHALIPLAALPLAPSPGGWPQALPRMRPDSTTQS